MLPPIPSNSSAICTAFLFLVPLNAICSKKCDMPFIFLVSFLLPVLTKTPIDTDSTSFISSAAILRPLSKVVIIIYKVALKKVILKLLWVYEIKHK